MGKSRSGSGSGWWGWIVASAAVAVVLSGVVAWWLVDPLSVDEPKDRANAMQAALAIAFGFGGLATLGLFTRRQWHQERAADDARHDAEQRRITEQYMQAVEQLGHEKAPVRLGGLYALDRLGRNHPEQRQVIADVWCAYLRRRYTPPPESVREMSGEEEGEEAAERDEAQLKVDAEAADEYEVRMTAQRLLSRHLKDPRSVEERDENRPEESEEFWHLERIDLTGAVLIEADFKDCRIPELKADNARFHRGTSFDRAYFEDGAWFVGARFERVAGFVRARFGSGAWFMGARFKRDARFVEAYFEDGAWFVGARFKRGAWFGEARIEHSVWFGEARFGGVALFGETQFGSDAADAVESASVPQVDMTDVAVDRVDFEGRTHQWPPGWGTVVDGDHWRLVRVEE